MKNITKSVLYRENGNPLYKDHNWVLKKEKLLIKHTKVYYCTKCNGKMIHEIIKIWANSSDFVNNSSETVIRTDVVDLNCEDVMIKNIIE